jgi:hypothetical protein
MKVVTIKVGEREMAFPENIYDSLLTGTIISAGENENDSLVRMGDWGTYTLKDICFRDLAEDLARGGTGIWDRLYKAGLPLAYFSVMAKKKMDEDIEWNNWRRDYIMGKRQPHGH